MRYVVQFVIPIVVSVMLSAFFSGTEIAYTAVNKLRLYNMAEESGRRTVKLAHKITENFDAALSAILLGNNFANIYSSSIATLLAIEIGRAFSLNEETSGTIATVAMTVIILIFGEIMPKIICKQFAMTISIAVAWPLKVLMTVLSPITFVVMKIVALCSKFWNKAGTGEAPMTEEEISTVIDTVEEEGVIDEEQGELLQSALDFGDITVHEILTPRINMIAIDIDDTLEEIVETAADSSFSRVPVYEDSIDHIIGILHVNTFFKEIVGGETPNIRDMLMEPYFVHKTMKLPALLSEMRARQTHLAIVLDEYGGTMGLVTMEDILEQIVGDIWDESDEIKTEFVELSENEFEASGTMNIYDFFDELEVSDRDFESECTTVGGWATECLESDPHEGDTFEYKNITLTVSEMGDNCITKVSVVRREVEEEE